MPDGDVAVLVSAILAAPGLTLDTLRLRAGLGRAPFEAAFAACRARGLLRPGGRADTNRSRTRIFPTPSALDAAQTLQPGSNALSTDQEDAS